jgi:hypothetical protein
MNGKSCKWHGKVKCHLHDFSFIGVICRGLYNFCLLACFEWDLF